MPLKLREDASLIEGAYEPFDVQKYLDGKLAPVFFGSAINNFGVKELLDTFTRIAPPPLGRPSDVRTVTPDEKNFTGFVFKIHANLDPRHRDRIAFLRICSGRFERNKLFHHVRLDKNIRFNSPASFLGQRKSIIDEAFPGDVIGLYDTGNFKIGDTLTEGENLQFQGIPSFSPEIFKELVNLDPGKSKQLAKGIEQLTDEGVAQLFTQQQGNRRIVGTVGELQFDVIQYRLEHEYNAKCRFHAHGHPQGLLVHRRRPEGDREVLPVPVGPHRHGQGREPRVPRRDRLDHQEPAAGLPGDPVPLHVGVQAGDAGGGVERIRGPGEEALTIGAVKAVFFSILISEDVILRYALPDRQLVQERARPYQSRSPGTHSIRPIIALPSHAYPAPYPAMSA